MKQPLICSVEAVEEQVVQLRTPDGQSLTLPLSSVHGTPVLGGTLRLMGVVLEGGRVEDSLFSKDILNELLNPPRS